MSLRCNNERHIRCEYCRKYPHIVKQHVPKKPPAITNDNGTRFHTRVLSEHLETLYHKECAKAYRISLVESENPAPMNVALSKVNKQQIDRVGKLMIQVFSDAKCLSNTAHTRPSRYIAGEASTTYDSLSSQKRSIISDSINLQYINKPSHSMLMTSIVESDRHAFQQKIADCVAISLRVGGSIDFTHIDNIYVMAKLMNADGSSESVFIGIAEQSERLAKGLFKTVKTALTAAFDKSDTIFRKISSVCTDGTNVNSGEKNDIWVLIEDEMKKVGSTIPLLKVWCAAHRAELVWKHAVKSVPEVSKVRSILSKMSTHFHFSAIRTAELKKIAADHGSRLLMIPKIFEIRWTDFTFKLLRNVLVSWETLVKYFQENKRNAECAGYLKYLTKLETMKQLAFLADVLFSFSRFQMKLQSDTLTILSMKSHIDVISKTLDKMKTTELPGGFEHMLAKQLDRCEDENKIYFKGIELDSDQSSRHTAANSGSMRKNILDAVCGFLQERFEVDQRIFSTRSSTSAKIRTYEKFIHYSLRIHRCPIWLANSTILLLEKR